MKKVNAVLILSLLLTSSFANAVAPKLTEIEPPATVQSLAKTTYSKFKIDKVRSFKLSYSTPLKRSMDLFLGVQVGSPWMEDDRFSPLLSAELLSGIQTLNQCGLGFNQIHVLYLNYNATGLKILAGFASASPYEPPFEFGLYKDLPSAARPIVVFNKRGTAKSYNATSIAAFSSIFGDEIAKVEDMAFVPSDTASGYNTRMFAQSSYSLLAHEMAHFLGNLAHVQLKTPNLMNANAAATLRQSGKLMSSDLNDEQCKAILNYPVRAQ